MAGLKAGDKPPRYDGRSVGTCVVIRGLTRYVCDGGAEAADYPVLPEDVDHLEDAGADGPAGEGHAQGLGDLAHLEPPGLHDGAEQPVYVLLGKLSQPLYPL